MLKMNPRYIGTLLLPLVLVLQVSGCSDDAATQADAVALNTYYKSNPPPRGWKVKTITPESSGKIVVDILVTSASDLNMIGSISRMQQFTVAKQGCPSAAALHSVLSGGSSVWVQLRSKTKVLTQTVCPTQ